MIKNNAEQLQTNLNLLEEVWEKAQVWMAAYQQKVVWYYNSYTRGKEFKIGNLVLHRTKVSQLME